MAKRKLDFTGLATAYNVKCDDGQTIMQGAFARQDGMKVPLMWRHKHSEMKDVVGHVILHAAEKGIRVDAYINDTDSGKNARQLIRAEDIDRLSIFANKLQRKGGYIKDGIIREVSLVLAGMNPGAKIENVLVHSADGFEPDEIDDTQAHMFFGESVIELPTVDEGENITHESAEDKTVGEILASLNEEQKILFSFLMHKAVGDIDVDMDSQASDEDGGKTLQEIYDTLTDEQETVIYSVIGDITEDVNSDENISHSTDAGGEEDMKNIFDEKNSDEGTTRGGEALLHSAVQGLVGDALGNEVTSFRRDWLAHAKSYGVENIEELFPDAELVKKGEPFIYDEDSEWVAMVTPKTWKQPFAKVKSRYADLKENDMRARGYITENEKFEDAFKVYSRETLPQTIYHKNQLDRDDFISITDFNVLMWLKSISKVKLREEIARAILVGDGRAFDDDDKIQEDKVRPIWTDDAFYSHKYLFQANDDYTSIIDGTVRAMNNYKGKGQPTLFCAIELLTEFLLEKDNNNRRLYPDKAAVARAMNVGSIVTVPQFSGLMRDDEGTDKNLLGIIVNLGDYVVGSNKLGKTTFFEDFDLNFNKHRTLLETNISGALVVPKSAVVLEQLVAEE